MPRPLFIFGSPSALENIRLPGLEIRSKVLITGFPEWYLSSKESTALLSSELILKSFINPSFLSISAIFALKFEDGNSTFLWFLSWAFLLLRSYLQLGHLNSYFPFYQLDLTNPGIFSCKPSCLRAILDIFNFL